MYSAEVQNQINIWRTKSAAGEITIDELRQAIKIMRGDRMATAEANAKAAKSPGGKAKKPAKSADEMFKELEGL